MSEQQILRILEEIRDLKLQALALQKEQLAHVKNHYDRAEAIQSKAEKLQDKALLATKIIVPVIFLLVLVVTWLIIGLF